jgi:hypothetical protein
MTVTINRNYTILDVEFDVDQLKDIVMHGMSAGVSGFIYTRDNVKHFDDNEDTIEEYLSDWYHDNMGEDNYIGAIAGAENNHSYPVASIDELKNRMVWVYVELKAFEILSENGYDF